MQLNHASSCSADVMPRSFRRATQRLAYAFSVIGPSVSSSRLSVSVAFCCDLMPLRMANAASGGPPDDLRAHRRRRCDHDRHYAWGALHRQSRCGCACRYDPDDACTGRAVFVGVLPEDKYQRLPTYSLNKTGSIWSGSVSTNCAAVRAVETP